MGAVFHELYNEIVNTVINGYMKDKSFLHLTNLWNEAQSSLADIIDKHVQQKQKLSRNAFDKQL